MVEFLVGGGKFGYVEGFWWVFGHDFVGWLFECFVEGEIILELGRERRFVLWLGLTESCCLKWTLW